MNSNQQLDIQKLVKNYDQELLRVTSENIRLKTLMEQQEEQIKHYELQMQLHQEANGQKEEIIEAESVEVEQYA